MCVEDGVGGGGAGRLSSQGRGAEGVETRRDHRRQVFLWAARRRQGRRASGRTRRSGNAANPRPFST